MKEEGHMKTIGFVLCPHLKGSREGALCGVANSLIKDMEGFSVKVCMSRHHEACSLYMRSLREMPEYGPCAARCL
jgi:hypothetical protein